MKRVLLFTMVMALAVAGVFAADSNTAKIKLDLDVDKFVVGFADSESNAKAFTPHTDDFLMASKNSGDTVKVAIDQDTAMYFFYDAAMKRANDYKLTAEIKRPLTQQNADDSGDAADADTINYTATITGGIDYSSFEDGTWVKNDGVSVTLETADSSKKSGDVVATLRDGTTGPFTVVYASAFGITLAVPEGQHIEGKKSAVYRSEIEFTVTAK